MKSVEVIDLKKHYEDVRAVDGISFSIDQGEVFGFLGPNGAGKTSTINMLTGLSRPTSGSVQIYGIDGIREIKRVQQFIGVVPDESNLYDEMNGFENLCFCASLYGIGKADRQERAKRLLESFHLVEAGKRPYKKYSKGMKRKLTIAAGIIHDPKILFLDEPTTGIDIESARQIRMIIAKIKEKGTTVFLTTHYIEEAERTCDQIAFIVDGIIVQSGSMNQLMQYADNEHRIRITLDTDASPITKKLSRHFPDLRAVPSADKTCTLSSPFVFPLSPILQYLDQQGVSVFEARQIRPSLEDVFVKVTGIEARKLRNDKEGRK